MIKGIQVFFQSAVQELKRVTWPTRDDVIKYTKIVIVASLAVALYILVLDFFLTEILKIIVGN